MSVITYHINITMSIKQLLEVCEINLKSPWFFQWQLYVAYSRVGNPSSLFFFSPDGKTRQRLFMQYFCLFDIKLIKYGIISIDSANNVLLLPFYGMKIN